MKSGEKRARIQRIYDTMEHNVDKQAEQRFRKPAALTGKLTKIAAVKIIERDIEALDDGDTVELERMAQKCMEWRKHKEEKDESSRYRVDRRTGIHTDIMENNR